MKKILSSVLIATLILSVLVPCLYAEGESTEPNGSSSNPSYIGFSNGDEEYDDVIYAHNEVKNTLDGVTYDEITNTLTIENVNTDKELIVIDPNTNFTLKVVGSNYIGGIEAYTFEGEGEEVVGLYITGNGALTVDSEKENAILLYSDFGGSTLRIGQDITLNLKSVKDVINNMRVQEKNGPTNRIILDSGENIGVANNIYTSNVYKTLDGYSQQSQDQGIAYLGKKVANANDPAGIYTVSYFNNEYTISKWIFAVDLGYYFRDISFGVRMTEDEFTNSEYTYITEENEYGDEEIASLTNPISLNYGTEYVYKDSDNKEYVVISNFEEVDSHYIDVKRVYDIVEIGAIPGKYLFTLNDSVNVDELTECVYEKVWDNVYNYTVQKPNLTIKPNSQDEPDPADEHNLIAISGTEETCTEPGYLPHFECTDCGKWFVDPECKEEIVDHSKATIPARGHRYEETSSKKATLSENGEIVNKCANCDSTIYESIFYPKTFTLSKTSYTYNGKVQKPTVTIKDCEGYTIDKSNYDVKYSSGCKNVGVYTVTITFKGNYDGSKKLTYKINPKGTTLSKVKAGKKSFTATWKKQATWTTGYEVMYSTSKTFKSGNKTVKITKNKTVKATVKKLKAKKKYYVKVRTYKTVNGKKYYSGWSAVKTVTTKK